VTRLGYVDTSALAKLVLDEPGSRGMLRWHVECERMVTSRVGIVEMRRVSARHAHDPAHLEVVLRSFEILELDAAIADVAGTVGPSRLRSLDAIHLATALELVPELDAFVTYDEGLAAAARAVGLPVVRPA
jgi:predicted nucleic acid-binding protein